MLVTKDRKGITLNPDPTPVELFIKAEELRKELKKDFFFQILRQSVPYGKEHREQLPLLYKRGVEVNIRNKHVTIYTQNNEFQFMRLNGDIRLNEDALKFSVDGCKSKLDVMDRMRRIEEEFREINSLIPQIIQWMEMRGY